jgi:hypothetical protein
MRLSDNKNEESGITPVSRSFHERLISVNNLDTKGFHEWIFHPEMLFGFNNKWWWDYGKRDISHEGLDLCYYRTGKGDIKHLDENTKVPLMFNGQVVKVCDDFLGESVFVRHDLYHSDINRLYTIYGHIKPGKDIYQGKRLDEGDVIGKLANKKSRAAMIPYHLHISAAWISDSLNQENLGWQILQNTSMVKLLNPLDILECPYSISSDI